MFASTRERERGSAGSEHFRVVRVVSGTSGQFRVVMIWITPIFCHHSGVDIGPVGIGANGTDSWHVYSQSPIRHLCVRWNPLFLVTIAVGLMVRFLVCGRRVVEIDPLC